MDLQPFFPRHADGDGMKGAAIAEQDDVGDRPARQYFIEETRPAGQAPAIVHGIGALPIDLVATVEVDPVDAMAIAPQRIAKQGEKWTGQSLKEEEFAPQTALHAILSIVTIGWIALILALCTLLAADTTILFAIIPMATIGLLSSSAPPPVLSRKTSISQSMLLRRSTIEASFGLSGPVAPL
ncbi:hypothetical protein [Sphingomonas nostoxanthinifaciens]|uniref:hypothetical protein n=1 Tax=Sphingomonas nostoxanthinifaciens TaxID=2872652 RepID=UPI001CC1F1CD|nr:hypothetical protein [Sphingomonas nostoxanthinifaciens]